METTKEHKSSLKTEEEAPVEEKPPTEEDLLIEEELVEPGIEEAEALSVEEPMPEEEPFLGEEPTFLEEFEEYQKYIEAGKEEKEYGKELTNKDLKDEELLEKIKKAEAVIASAKKDTDAYKIAKAELKGALDAQDADQIMEAQDKLTKLAVEKEKVSISQIRI